MHIAGHPPGALVFFVALTRIGLGSGLAAGFAVTVIAATTAVAVLMTVRELGAESMARRAAPFLVLGPAAIWQAVSADAMFAAVAAWGLTALAFAATRRSIGRSGGALLARSCLLRLLRDAAPTACRCLGVLRASTGARRLPASAWRAAAGR